MRTTAKTRLGRALALALPAVVLASAFPAGAAETPPAAAGAKPSLVSLLDAPLLFVKRNAYMAGHI